MQRCPPLVARSLRHVERWTAPRILAEHMTVLRLHTMAQTVYVYYILLSLIHFFTFTLS